MDTMSLVLATAIIFAASFFSTASGFGFALIATPLLCLIMDTKVAIILVLIMNILLRFLTMYFVWGEFDWKTVNITTLGTIIGMVPGSYVLKYMSAAQLGIFLGTVLLVAVFLMSREYRLEVKNKTVGRLVCGVLSGFFGASTSVSGPPVILYFLNENTPKEEMRANLIWIFGLSGFLTVIASYFAGNVNVGEIWKSMIFLTPAIFLAAHLGQKAFNRINKTLFRRISLLVVCAGSIMMLVNGIRAL